MFVSNFKKKISIVYDRSFHVDFHRCYQRITETLYFLQFVVYFRVYIKKCHVCQFNQICRHLLYEVLIFMKFIMLLFHIIIIDFVLILSNCHEMICLLILTNKIIKVFELMSNKNIYSISN